MRLKSTILIYLKELKDILRDRRTLLSMILFPVILIPLLSIGMTKFAVSRYEKLISERSTIAWISNQEVDVLLLKTKGLERVNVLTDIGDTTTVIEMLREKGIDAAVVVPDGFYSKLSDYLNINTSEAPPNITVYSDDTREKSQHATRRITDLITEYRSNLVAEHLVARGLPEQFDKPFWVMRQNIASAQDMGRMFAGSFLPYIVILMALTGAMYPAIDLTAGEKERGTLETLLVSGVNRIDVVLGKFLTVFTASIVTATLAVGSLAVTGMGLLGSSPAMASELNFSIEPLGVILMVVAMIPLGAIFASLLMTLSLYAKSYREAQSYISPLMVLVIVPAMASLMPDTELNRELALVPVLNVSMMMKDALMGNINPGTLAITMVVNLALAAGCLMLVLRMFQRESVLFRI